MHSLNIKPFMWNCVWLYWVVQWTRKLIFCTQMTVLYFKTLQMILRKPLLKMKLKTITWSISLKMVMSNCQKPAKVKFVQQSSFGTPPLTMSLPSLNLQHIFDWKQVFNTYLNLKKPSIWFEIFFSFCSVPLLLFIHFGSSVEFSVIFYIYL